MKIHDVQGSTNLANGTLVGVAGAADASPMLDEKVRVQAVVTQVLPGLGGFYIQEEDADADGDAYSSEGVFIYSSASVSVGDLITVEGTVKEYFGQTEIVSDAVTVDSSGHALPTATVIEFPTATVVGDADGDYIANLEAYEGMLVTIPEVMTVSELFQLDRFGTIRLTSEGRIETYTQTNAPSVTGYQDFLQEVASRSLVIDDGSTVQNPAEIKVPFLGEDGVLSNGDVFRMGYAYTGLTGVIGFSEDVASSSEEPEYRIHLPSDGELVQANPRPAEVPDVGGSVKVAAFNVLNYFTTLSGGTGPDGSQDPRGANNATEFERQQDKLVTAILKVAADVISLLEIENDPQGSTSLIALTSALNAAGGTYAYVDAGPIEGAMGGALEGDAIKVGFLYAYARAYDETVMVSIKNGGGIRASIGETYVPTGGDVVRAPNGEILDGDGNVIKPEGGISEADIKAALAFNNALSVVTVTRAKLVAILEHGVAAVQSAGGQFAQVSGVQLSYDPAQPAGSRIVNAAITDAEGNDLDVLVRDGVVVGDADATVRIVTLGFLADGGDGYPFPAGGGTDRVNLTDLDNNGVADGTVDGVATFADNGTEQDAFAEYLAEFFATPETAFGMADTGYDGDTRIQNLAYRKDTVIDEPEFQFVLGGAGRDNLVGTDAAEIFVSGAGNYDQMTGGGGADVFYFGAEALDGVRERDTITDYEVGQDVIMLGDGVSIASLQQAGSTVVAYLADPTGKNDAIYIRGDGVSVDTIVFVSDDPLAAA